LTAAEDDSLERVQSKIAYLERAIVELSDAVFRQHRDIQSIEAQLKAIRDRMAGTPSCRWDRDRDPARRSRGVVDPQSSQARDTDATGRHDGVH
jgi:uncharacterized coiled-coil protein SlyX